MLNESDAQAIVEQLLRLQVLFERPTVQWQTIAFIIAALVAWLLSDGVWHLYGQRFTAMVNNRLSERSQWYWQRGALFIRFLTFPILGLITVGITVSIFEAQGWRFAFIADLGALFGWIFYYRLLITILYIVLGEAYMSVYYTRLLSPLFILLVVFRILSNAIDMNRMSEIVLFDSFGNPLKVGALVIALVGLYFWIFFSRAIQDLLQGVIVPRTKADPNVVNATLTIGRYLVIGGAIVIVAAALGADMSTLALISGGLSVGIGFGLQEIVANFISGILLLFEQSLRPNDIVSVDGQMVVVKNLGIRATTVRTFDNVEVIIPNQVFLTSSVTTYTKTDRSVRVLLTVGAGYDNNPEEVIDLLLAVAEQHPLVQEEPEPAVHFMGFGDSSIDFRLAVWVDDPMIMLKVASDLRSMIWKTFAEHNIEIPYPQRDLHIRSGVPWEQFDVKTNGETVKPAF